MKITSLFNYEKGFLYSMFCRRAKLLLLFVFFVHKRAHSAKDTITKQLFFKTKRRGNPTVPKVSPSFYLK